MLENVRNLAKYIKNKGRTLGFDIPEVEISKNDNAEVRDNIMSITPKEAREEFGIRYRSTLKKIKDRIRKEIIALHRSKPTPK